MAAQFPFLTIITATYNSGDLIEKTANSLKEQSFKNFEWIIVDGASTDSTLDIVKKIKDLNIRYISEVDLGIYDAWNKGLSLASGEWVAFLGAGDCYCPKALSQYVNAIRLENIDIDFISSKIELIDTHGAVLRVVGAKFDLAQHKKYMSVAHVGAFHRKKLFKDNGRFDITYQSSGDYEYLMRCGKDLKPSFLDIVTATMLIGGVSNSFRAIIETSKIQYRYGLFFPIVILNIFVTLIKNLLRRCVYGY